MPTTAHTVQGLTLAPTAFNRRLVFGLHVGGSIISRAIRWQTRGRYSHVSSVMPDGTLVEAVEGRGVTAERMLWDVREHVTLLAVGCTEIGYERSTAFLADQIGKGYDYRMALGFVTRPTRQGRKSTGAWFCSELAYARAEQAAVHLFRATLPWEVNPVTFARSPWLVEVDRHRYEQFARRLFDVAVPGTRWQDAASRATSGAA